VSSFWQRLRRWGAGLALPLAVAFVVRATLVQAYHIPSGSMEDTFMPGDFVLAEKVSFGPHVPGRVPGGSALLPSVRVPGLRSPRPGDLVIFQHPEQPDVDLVKRCVAIAGQEVEIRDKRLYVDGVAVADPPGMKHVDPRRLAKRDRFGPYVVPRDHFFALGDNRDQSFDSRFFGAVPIANLRARPVAIYFSWDSAGRLADRIRWRHLGAVR
jgi:signal peptidase I